VELPTLLVLHTLLTTVATWLAQCRQGLQQLHQFLVPLLVGLSQPNDQSGSQVYVYILQATVLARLTFKFQQHKVVLEVISLGR
jgi:hypothetical protein